MCSASIGWNLLIKFTSDLNALIQLHSKKMDHAPPGIGTAPATMGTN